MSTTITQKSATTTANHVMLLKKDYEILNEFVKNQHGMQVNEKENFGKLSIELSKAKVVSESELPDDVIRIDSLVTIKDVATKRDMAITIVLPANANIKEKKVSVLAPIGTALIGFRKGQEVSWDVPAGTKTFKIVEVDNSSLSNK